MEMMKTGKRAMMLHILGAVVTEIMVMMRRAGTTSLPHVLN